MDYLVLGALLVLVGAGSAEKCTDIDSIACSLLHAKLPSLCQDPTLSGACKRYCGQCPIICNSCPQLVQDPGECNETVTCGHGEVCYMMETTDFDHKRGFRGGCVNKDLCVPDYQSILVGRRSNSNVKMDCCTEDNCNIQVFKTDITTTIMTTKAAPMTTRAPYHIVTHHCVDNPLHNCHQHLDRCGDALHHIYCKRSCGYCYNREVYRICQKRQWIQDDNGYFIKLEFINESPEESYERIVDKNLPEVSEQQENEMRKLEIQRQLLSLKPRNPYDQQL